MHRERPVLLDVLEVVRGVGGEHDRPVRRLDARHLRARRVPARVVHRDAGRELRVAVEQPHPSLPLERGETVDVVAFRVVAELAALGVGTRPEVELRALGHEGRRGERLDVANVVVVEVREDHERHRRGVRAEARERLARRLDEGARAALVALRREADVEYDVLIRRAQQPREKVQHHLLVGRHRGRAHEVPAARAGDVRCEADAVDLVDGDRHDYSPLDDPHDGRVVVRAVARGRRALEQLVRERRRRQGRVKVGCRLERVRQVLHHVGRRKDPLAVHVGQQRLAPVVLEHEARGRAVAERLPRELRVDEPAAAHERDRLGERDDRLEDDHVVEDLHERARAVRTAVQDVGGHGPQQRLDGREVLRGSLPP